MVCSEFEPGAAGGQGRKSHTNPPSYVTKFIKHYIVKLYDLVYLFLM